MISRIEKVTIYVNSQEEAKKFWTEKIGFKIILEMPMGSNNFWIEAAPEGENLTSLVLYSKQAMMEFKPEMVVHPNIIFATEDIENLYNNLKAKDVEVSELQSQPYGKMFNFKDQDGNDYMVRQ